MGTASRRSAFLAALSCVLLLSSNAKAGDSTVRGLVRDQSTEVPVELAQVSLDRKPADGVPEVRAISDLAGAFIFGALDSGDYALKIEHPAYETKTFDLSLSAAETKTQKFFIVPHSAGPGGAPPAVKLELFATDIRSATPLTDAKFTVERYADEGASAPPISAVVLPGDANGFVSTLVASGFYRIHAARPGWESLTLPGNAGPPTFLLREAHSGVAAMRPLPGQRMLVQVRGFDPVFESVGELKGAIVELTGVAFDTDRVVVPKRIAITDARGHAIFPNLQPLRWKVAVKKRGYTPVELTFHCTAAQYTVNQCRTQVIGTDGFSFSGFVVPSFLELHAQTAVRVELHGPWVDPKWIIPTQVFLRGIDGTETEGINRFGFLRTDQDSGDGMVAHFDQILPGRYAVDVRLDNVHRVPVALGGPNLTPLANVGVRSRPVLTTVEVADKEVAGVPIQLDIEPAVVRGRIRAVDRLRRDPAAIVSGSFQGAEERIFSPLAGAVVQIAQHASATGYLPSSTQALETTGADGNFTVLVLPGAYGVRMPGATAYASAAGRMRAEDPYNPLLPPIEINTGWPMADPFPFRLRQRSAFAPFVTFESGKIYELELTVNRKFVDVHGVIALQDPFTLALLASGSVSVFSPMLATGGVTLSGPVQRTPALIAGDFGLHFNLDDLPPGHYSLTGTHGDYTFQPATVEFDVPEFPDPGGIPAVDPDLTAIDVPGFRYELDIIQSETFGATRKGPLQIRSIQFRSWIEPTPTEPGHYGDPSAGAARGPVVFSSRPGIAYGTTGSDFPTSGCVIHAEISPGGASDDWFKVPCGTDAPTIFLGGPDSSLSASNAPPGWGTPYALELRTELGEGIAIDGVSLRIAAGAEVVTTPANVTTSSPCIPQSTDPKWSIVGTRRVLLETSAVTVRCTVTVQRQMAVLGRVLASGTGVAGARVTFLDRHGRQRGDAVDSAADGSYGGTTGATMGIGSVWLEVKAAGFKPARKRFEPTAGTIDIVGADVALETLPPPVISAAELDRSGSFLVGITKAGNPAGFSRFSALPALTLTWKAPMHATGFVAHLDPLDPDNVGPRPAQAVAFGDEITEAWLVDRRAFALSLPDEVPIIVDPATLSTPAAIHRFLRDVTKGARNGAPFVVAFSRGTESATERGTWTGKVFLPELPTGRFEPMVIAITRQGSALVREVQLPAGGQALEGIGIPWWARGLGDALGDIAGVGVSVDPTEWLPDGTLVPLPEFSVSIGADSEGFLTYSYAASASWKETSKNPSNGLLALAPRYWGLPLKAQIQFDVQGKGPAFALAISGTMEQSFVDDNGLLDPAITGTNLSDEQVRRKVARRVVKITEFKLSGQGSIQASQILGAGQFPDYGLTLFYRVDGNSEIHVDLTPVLSRLPYIGPPLQLLREAGVAQFNAVFGMGIGLKLTQAFQTVQPQSGGSQTGQPQQISWLGIAGRLEQAKPPRQLDLFLRILVGMGLSLFEGSAEAVFAGQLGGAAGGESGLQFTFGGDNWPALERVQGALSAVLRTNLKILKIGISKSFQWDAIPLDWKNEPAPAPASPALRLAERRGALVADTGDAFFHLGPTGEKTRYVMPTTSPEPQWQGGMNGVLIADAYSPGLISVAAGRKGGALAWIHTKPSGEMSMRVSVPGRDGMLPPLVVATAGGIGEVAIARLADGTLLAVWSELPAEDLASPFASCTLRYATLADGAAAWSAAAEIAALGRLVGAMRLARAGDQAVLVFTERDGVEAFGSLAATVKSARFASGSFAAPIEVAARRQVASLALSGDETASPPAALLALLDGAGVVAVLDWDGSVWTAGASPAGDVVRLDASHDRDHRALLALIRKDGTVSLLRREAAAPAAFAATAAAAALLSFNTVADLDTPAPSEVRTVEVASTNERMQLVVWTERVIPGKMRAAFLRESGTVSDGPRDVVIGAAGVLKEVALVPVEDELAARAIFRLDDGAHDMVRETKIAFGKNDVLDLGGSIVLPGGGADAGPGPSADAGPDAGTGAGPDAGADAGTGPVGGGPSETPQGTPRGCGCSGGTDTGLSTLLFAVAWLAARRRSRRDGGRRIGSRSPCR